MPLLSNFLSSSFEGSQGIQGTTGTGSQGIQGTTGTGTQGLQGIQGIQGISVQGIQGIQGPQPEGTFSVTNDVATNSTFYPVFVNSTLGVPTQTSVSDSKLSFNPSTGTFSATIFTSLSDASKKTDIHLIENAVEIVKKLNGVRYKLIDDHNQPSIGVIAQEVEQVLPEVVITNSEGLKSVSYGNLVGLLIEAIKEQQNQIECLKNKINIT